MPSPSIGTSPGAKRATTASPRRSMRMRLAATASSATVRPLEVHELQLSAGLLGGEAGDGLEVVRAECAVPREGQDTAAPRSRCHAASVPAPRRRRSSRTERSTARSA
jgi:hypothetical protein